METFKFVAGKLAKAALVLLGIAILNFFLIRAAPGDPALVLAGESGSADDVYIAQLRAQFGLDRSLLYQAGVYLKNYMTFDLGYSVRQQAPVFSLIVDRLPATILLTGTAFAFSLLFGVTLGIVAALRAGKWSDSAVMVIALVLYATPLFWFALMAQIVFSLKLEWLPNIGYETIGSGFTGFRLFFDRLVHLILPAATLSVFFMAICTRMMRASMLEVASADFVKTARAKGLSPNRIVIRHIARNAMLPIITLAGLQAGQLVSGAVLTETVFAWPGIGRLMFDALLQRDYPVLLGVFFISSAMVVAINIITDILYRVVDPRIGGHR